MMSETKKASLTVLGGPLGGSRAVLPEEGEVTIGSAEGCSFQLDAPGVSPLHARVVLEAGRATVFSTGADRPLHINDDPLGAESATLRNGDILWLGVPGEDNVVMLQCILAPQPTAAPPPTAAVAEPTPDIETQALWIASQAGAQAEAPNPSMAEPPGEHEPLLMEFDSPAEREAVVATGAELVSDHDLAPVNLEESEEAVVVDEDELFTEATPTFVEASSELTPPADEVLSAEHLEPAVPAPVKPPPTPPVEPMTPAPATPGPASRASTPTASVASTRAAETSPPSAAPPAPSRRERSAPRRRPTPPRADREHTPEEAEAPSRNPVVLALVGFVGVLVVAILGWVVWRFVLQPAPTSSPTPVAAASAAPPPPVSTPPPPEMTPTPVAPTSEPTATPEELAVPTAAPTPPLAATPQPTPTPRPTPTPPPTPAAAPASPPQPSAAEQRAQQTAVRVEGLLGQADTALAARQYAAAIGHLDEALVLAPDDSRARTTRARAVALRDLANRRFVGGRTRVQTEKEQGGGLAGFDTGDADVRKAPDFQGRIEFEMSPASGVAGGDPWTLRVFVVNEGDKPIRIQGVDVVTQVNGAGGGGAVAPRTQQVPTQQRVLVGEVSGTWVEGTSSWSTQITVTANKGDSLRASLTWR